MFVGKRRIQLIVSTGVAFALTLLSFSGCGYTLQNSHNPLGDKEGIRKIYIAPLVNNTYKPGVENVVYNAIVQSISVHRRVKLVNSPEDADAILKGTVMEADYNASISNQFQSLSPASLATNPVFQNILVATEYTATLMCGFSLEREHPDPNQKKLIWSSGFSRNQPFAASNQLGAQGTTSALINESEFDRALTTIATSMSADVHESMLDMF